MSSEPSGILVPALEFLIAHPDLAVFFVLAGVFLLYAEFNRPGAVVFGAMGVLLGTPGGYALLQHPVDAGAAAVLPLAICLGVAGVRFPAAGALGILTLTWSLHHLLLAPEIAFSSAFLASASFVLVTGWLGRIALQARRNKRLPPRRSPISDPTPPHPLAR